jgi:hypothetical protein
MQNLFFRNLTLISILLLLQLIHNIVHFHRLIGLWADFFLHRNINDNEEILKNREFHSTLARHLNNLLIMMKKINEDH